MILCLFAAIAAGACGGDRPTTESEKQTDTGPVLVSGHLSRDVALRGNPFRQIYSGEQVKQAPNQPWIGTLVSAWWNASIPMNKVRTENERL